MIEYLNDLPSNIVGFKATGNVYAGDFREIVLPRVKEFLAHTAKLNYLLLLDTSIKKFSIGAWFMDLLLGIMYMFKWQRIAIVTDVSSIRKFTNLHTFMMPGKYQGFEKKDLQKAIAWVSMDESTVSK